MIAGAHPENFVEGAVAAAAAAAAVAAVADLDGAVRRQMAAGTVLALGRKGLADAEELAGHMAADYILGFLEKSSQESSEDEKICHTRRRGIIDVLVWRLLRYRLLHRSNGFWRGYWVGR